MSDNRFDSVRAHRRALQREQAYYLKRHWPEKVAQVSANIIRFDRALAITAGEKLAPRAAVEALLACGMSRKQIALIGPTK